MGVKIGRSYISEAATFAKSQIDDDEKNILKNLPEETESSPAAKVEISKKKFADTNELVKELQKNFSVMKNGAASISKKYLRECLNDEDKQRKLFENLQAADEIYKNAEKNQNVRVKIDSEGEMTIESSKTTVTFNESKRARQLAAAETLEDVQALMNLLQTDLDECEEGLKNDWCDEAEVEKVKKMIERAKQKLGEVKTNPPKKSFSPVDVLI